MTKNYPRKAWLSINIENKLWKFFLLTDSEKHISINTKKAFDTNQD